MLAMAEEDLLSVTGSEEIDRFEIQHSCDNDGEGEEQAEKF